LDNQSGLFVFVESNKQAFSTNNTTNRTSLSNVSSRRAILSAEEDDLQMEPIPDGFIEKSLRIFFGLHYVFAVR